MLGAGKPEEEEGGGGGGGQGHLCGVDPHGGKAEPRVDGIEVGDGVGAAVLPHPLLVVVVGGQEPEGGGGERQAVEHRVQQLEGVEEEVEEEECAAAGKLNLTTFSMKN